MTKCLPLLTGLLLLTIACGDAAMTASHASAPLQGTVIDADGEPAGNVTVAIGEVVTRTDVDGKFALPSAPAHYDAALTVGRSGRAYVFKSLTSRAPTLRLFDVALSLRSHTAQVRVTLPEPLPEGAKLVVTAASSNDAARIADVVPDQDSEGVVVSVRWLGPPVATLDLFAIAYEPDAATLAPARYIGVATARGARVEHLQPITVPLRYEPQPAEESTVRARVATPSGHALEWTSLFVDLGPNARRTKLADRLGGDPAVSFRVPELPGATFHVEANAYDGGNDLATFASGALGAKEPEAVLDLARAPQLRGPGRDATRVSHATEFAWERAGGAGVTWVYFGPEDQSRTDEPRVWVATPDSATTIPDLHALGIDLPRRTRGVWYVVAARGAKSVEDAAAQGLFRDAVGAGGNTGALKYTTE